MQVAPRGPACGSHSRKDLAHLHRVPCPDGDGLQVVVGGDQTVAVVNFHAVPTTPGVPPRGPDHTGVGGVNPGAATRGEILAEVEVPGMPRDGTNAEPEGRALREYFQGRHQGALRRPLQLGGSHIQRSFTVLCDRPDNGPAERDEGPAVRQDRGPQDMCTNVAGGGARQCGAGLARRDER
jgi:hypothetical protein